MKIYSKFHDYYDSVLKYSQTEDDGVVYAREQEEIVLNINQAEIKLVGKMKYFQDENISFIGFCGKIYPVYKYGFEQESKDEIFIIGFDDELLKTKLEELKKKTQRRFYNPCGSMSLDFLLGLLTDWWREYTFTNPFRLEDFFIKYETPVFLFEEWGVNEKKNRQWKLTKNPCLKDFNFQRIVDPYTAFQEISMFFNSTLTNVKTPKMPVGNDVVLAESKGFDKWSFRKMGENSK